MPAGILTCSPAAINFQRDMTAVGRLLKAMIGILGKDMLSNHGVGLVA